MFVGGGYDEKVDIWSAGITLYEAIHKRTPFASQYHSETIENIQNM
jgi:calcium-dependent protein kinase